MNFRRKSHYKLKIFGSFNVGSKSWLELHHKDTDFPDKSIPVLLGIKHNHQEQFEKSVAKSVQRHSSLSVVNDNSELDIKIPHNTSFPTTRSFSLGAIRDVLHKNKIKTREIPVLTSEKSNSIDDQTFIEKLSPKINYREKELPPKLNYYDNENRLNSNVKYDDIDMKTVESTARRSPSVDDSLISDSYCDSGAFSRNSTPEPEHVTLQQNILKTEIAPLISPPLVMSVTRSRTQTRHKTGVKVPETRDTRQVTREYQTSPVTVTIGATTRLCVNEFDQCSLYQSLPNLFKNESNFASAKVSKMPYMGTSRLVTPPKPLRVKSALVSNTSTLEHSRKRTKISTSTVMLNRSNTSIGYVNVTGDMTSTQDSPTSMLKRSARDGSCCSDTSSGVYSLGSAPDMNHVQNKTICKVTVNGQLL